MFGSIYLRHSEGLSKTNLAFLQEVAGVLLRLEGQWLVGGDFNFAPDVLRKSGWLQLVQGTVHQPESPTCNG